jgi:5-methylcytosine-specific restriction endonuclease McrA
LRCRKQYFKDYYIQNKDKYKKYYEENKESILARKKEYVKNNKDKVKISNAKRRSKKKKLLSDLTNEEWETIKEFFGNTCCYCNKKSKLNQDHFIPLSKGGVYSKNNILPACGSCNSSKNNNDFKNWYQNYKHYNKDRELKILNYIKEVSK